MKSVREIFAELSGRQLHAVTFVLDYLQLWFEGPGINVYNPISILDAGRDIRSGSPGFRDAICGQIAKIVVEVEISEDVALAIRFGDQSQIAVSLRPDDYTGPEAFETHGFSDPTIVVG